MEEKMHQSKDNKFIPMTSISSGKGREIRNDVFYYTNQIVNVIMIGDPAGDWVLIDAGMPKSGEEIVKVAEKRFGKGKKPVAIILTHGHFDHVGGLVHLINEWGVPVYAHPLEFLYLTGEKRYPEPDTSVEGGMLAKISSIYPIEPINISGVLRELPTDFTVPGLPEWKWIHVPGHSPGQVALFREKDKVLIAADAFVTVKQDSMYKVLVQKTEVQGPPVYLTTNWEMAEESVQKLEALKPDYAVTGHGSHMEGEELKQGLKHLADNFKEDGVPSHGKFVRDERKK
ncbi:MBL fold metallo-hydrolase [Antarcticibacterium sp. 1MA-6-2]|uniref:MBL fold metallo-hydrolase n=1 Tax=Antarcticibacterium sp. 1MA-6-2 TaxID=2908210 RepID=UPI001F48DFCC|nr:MBL fold metallo-hydrolase [Antarcticibacterium sp. 1MA-6-2]UJH91059.1 MBL fold metallo-hydrolase [Antarcticibacterium sp. 1MA-6-2]